MAETRYEKQLNLRLMVADIERIERLAEALAKRTPGMNATTSGAARIALLRGLDEIEKELGKTKTSEKKAKK